MTYKVRSGGAAGFLRRNSNTISIIVILLSFIAIFLMQAITIAQLQKDVEGQTAVIKRLTSLASQIDSNSKERSTQIDGIDRHLDCIVYFFSQTDRSQKAIDDIDNCRITDELIYSSPDSSPKASPQASKPIEQQPLEDTPPKPEKGVVEKTVDGILNIPEVVTNKLKEIL